jgi:protoporphyrinogen oxidase
MQVAVIGAGPAGMTAAYALAKRGVRVDVYEAAPFVGGMAATIELWNQRVDLGPHRFFSSDRLVNELWLDVVGRDYDMIERTTRIFYDQKFFHYPLRTLDSLHKLGLLEAAHCMASYARQKLQPIAEDGTFENWVVSRFGRRLFEIFFKAYSEKLWGIPCTALDADFAAQRIKRLDLMEAVKNAVMGGRGNEHKTLVDHFAYPRGGTGVVYERMAQGVEAAGSRVLLRTPVRGVSMTHGRATGVELENGERRDYDQIVSSMPLTLLVQSLSGAPDDVVEATKKLKFRNTILVYLRVEGASTFPDNWLYVHAPELSAGRITNFRNWGPSLYGAERDTILALEYWCSDDEPMWKKDNAELIALGTRELAATGLSSGAAVKAGYVHRVRRCYPVYERGYRRLLEPVETYVKSVRGLWAIGRYGAFKYNNQDHSILMGLRAAENVLGAEHDLFAINSDYDTYQEQAVITATGLEKRPSKYPPPAIQPSAAPPAPSLPIPLAPKTPNVGP